MTGLAICENESSKSASILVATAYHVLRFAVVHPHCLSVDSVPDEMGVACSLVIGDPDRAVVILASLGSRTHRCMWERQLQSSDGLVEGHGLLPTLGLNAFESDSRSSSCSGRSGACFSLKMIP